MATVDATTETRSVCYQRALVVIIITADDGWQHDGAMSKKPKAKTKATAVVDENAVTRAMVLLSYGKMCK